MNDLRIAVRSLRATPIVTIVVLLSLALGIGVNTAMFSIVNSLLLRALPVDRPDRLVLLLSNPSVNPSFPWSNPVWEQIRDRHSTLFEAAFAFSRRTTRVNFAQGGRTDFVNGIYASGQYFDALRVRHDGPDPNEDDLRLAIQRPWMAFGSDGQSVAPDGPLSEGMVHPRSYGTYSKVFGEYVRKLGLIRLEDAVRRASSLPAQRLGIRDRGLLREGFYADIVVFDPLTIGDRATYEKPHQFSAGIPFVLVNGEVVVDDGRITKARPGMIVRGPGYRPHAS